ncbi:MAG: hypothetical protein LBU82_06815 [Treponema sp.]|jgi:hypothetical protein|nr:hypothetical protein [Treponema sp.]
MQAFEFDTVIENEGVIHIPKQYLEKVSSPVRIILLTNEDNLQNKSKHFTAVKIKTKGFKFDRDFANST